MTRKRLFRTSTAHLDEVFLSIQGEGGDLGRPHLFVRFGGCPLRCSYCDTERSWQRREQFQWHAPDGTSERDNPLDLRQFSQSLQELAQAHGCVAEQLVVALTGGEPLLQNEFLQAWLPQWSGPTLLETAGLYPQRLATLLPHLTMLSLDWKIENLVVQGSGQLAAAECVRLAHQARGDGLQAWCKIVVAESTTEQDLAAALEEIAKLAPQMQVLLQPVTPTHTAHCPPPPPTDRLLQWLLQFAFLPLDLRVIPQTHPILGVR